MIDCRRRPLRGIKAGVSGFWRRRSDGERGGQHARRLPASEVKAAEEEGVSLADFEHMEGHPHVAAMIDSFAESVDLSAPLSNETLSHEKPSL